VWQQIWFGCFYVYFTAVRGRGGGLPNAAQCDTYLPCFRSHQYSFANLSLTSLPPPPATVPFSPSMDILFFFFRGHFLICIFFHEAPSPSLSSFPCPGSNLKLSQASHRTVIRFMSGFSRGSMGHLLKLKCSHSP
jgi:hypothetical protein